MKKINKIRIIKFLALLLPIIVVIGLSQHFFFYYVDMNTDRIRDFYREEENSLDVVLVGASEVFTGYAPAYVYDQFGFTSYIYAIDANPGSLYKYQIKEIMNTQDPQLILVEVNGFVESDNEDEARLRLFTENIPMSVNKVEAIWNHSYEDKLSCVFPVIKYHGDWLNPGDLYYRMKLRLAEDNGPSMLKGAITYTDVDERDVWRQELEPLALDEGNEAYLLDFLSFCEKEQLDNVVFVRFPHKPASEYYYEITALANRVGEIVTEHGFRYLNLEEKCEEIGIDFKKDFYNSGHLNAYGQMKLSDYLGHYMVDMYQITPSVQSEQNREQWELSAKYMEAYFAYAIQKLEERDAVWVNEEADVMEILECMVHQSA